MTRTHDINLPNDADPDDDPTDDDIPISELERLTAISDYSIEKIIERLEGRIRNPEHEKVRQRYLGLLSTHIRTRLSVREQREIDELADDIQELRAELAVEELEAER